MHILQAGREHEPLSRPEEPMTTVEFITALFCQVDTHLHNIPKHPHATLWPSEVVTLGLLHALKGVGNRAFYRWLTRDYRGLFPHVPERTRLFRLFKTHQVWTEVWGKLCLVVNQYGLVVAWDCATANVADNTFQELIRQFEERMIILSDMAFHAAEGDPSNLKLCRRGEREERILIETVLSMLTLVCHFKKVMHRGWAYFHARLAFTMAAFNVLVQWHGLRPNALGFVPLSIAEFSL